MLGPFLRIPQLHLVVLTCPLQSRLFAVRKRQTSKQIQPSYIQDNSVKIFLYSFCFFGAIFSFTSTKSHSLTRSLSLVYSVRGIQHEHPIVPCSGNLPETLRRNCISVLVRRRDGGKYRQYSSIEFLISA